MVRNEPTEAQIGLLHSHHSTKVFSSHPHHFTRTHKYAHAHTHTQQDIKTPRKQRAVIVGSLTCVSRTNSIVEEADAEENPETKQQQQKLFTRIETFDILMIIKQTEKFERKEEKAIDMSYQSHGLSTVCWLICQT